MFVKIAKECRHGDRFKQFKSGELTAQHENECSSRETHSFSVQQFTWGLCVTGATVVFFIDMKLTFRT
jgi:hypothetical protein